MKYAWFRRLLRAFCFLVLIPGFAFADGHDTDVVIFDNGDRLTCEVKSLKRGRLKFKTEATGTIDIEWENVAFLSSDRNLQVGTSSGDHYLGTLEMAENSRELVVVTGQGPIAFEDDQVVELAQVDQKDWRSWDIDLSTGYNFTSANSSAQFNFGVAASHRTAIREIAASYSALMSSSESSDTSQSQNLEFDWTRLRSNRWLTVGTLAFTENTQLGVDLRSSLGGGIGRVLNLTNSSSFVLGGGLKVSEESTIDVPEDTTSLEAYANLAWDWYHYDAPEWDISADFELIPSLTEQGRVRYVFDTTVKWEIINDFYWSIQVYDNFDSQPQSEDAANHDYGVISSITYDLR